MQWGAHLFGGKRQSIAHKKQRWTFLIQALPGQEIRLTTDVVARVTGW